MKYGGIRVTLGTVLPDHGAWQARFHDRPAYPGARGARAAARQGFLAQVTGVWLAEVLGRARLHGRGQLGEGHNSQAGRSLDFACLDGDRGAGKLLIASQIVFSPQLSFAHSCR
jgi:hypothetical protein